MQFYNLDFRPGNLWNYYKSHGKPIIEKTYFIEYFMAKLVVFTNLFNIVCL